MLLADLGWKPGGSELPGPQSAHRKKKIIQDHQIGETRFQGVKGAGSWRIWCDPCMVTELISWDPHSSGGRGMVTGGGIGGVRRRRGRSGVHLQRSPPPSDLWAGTHHGVHSQILFLRVTFCSTPRRRALLTWKTILPSKTQTGKKMGYRNSGTGHMRTMHTIRSQE